MVKPKCSVQTKHRFSPRPVVQLALGKGVQSSLPGSKPLSSEVKSANLLNPSEDTMSAGTGASVSTQCSEDPMSAGTGASVSTQCSEDPMSAVKGTSVSTQCSEDPLSAVKGTSVSTQCWPGSTLSERMAFKGRTIELAPVIYPDDLEESRELRNFDLLHVCMNIDKQERIVVATGTDFECSEQGQSLGNISGRKGTQKKGSSRSQGREQSVLNSVLEGNGSLSIASFINKPSSLFLSGRSVLSNQRTELLPPSKWDDFTPELPSTTKLSCEKKYPHWNATVPHNKGKLQSGYKRVAGSDIEGVPTSKLRRRKLSDNDSFECSDDEPISQVKRSHSSQSNTGVPSAPQACEKSLVDYLKRLDDSSSENEPLSGVCGSLSGSMSASVLSETSDSGLCLLAEGDGGGLVDYSSSEDESPDEFNRQSVNHWKEGNFHSVSHFADDNLQSLNHGDELNVNSVKDRNLRPVDGASVKCVDFGVQKVDEPCCDSGGDLQVNDVSKSLFDHLGQSLRKEAEVNDSGTDEDDVNHGDEACVNHLGELSLNGVEEKNGSHTDEPCMNCIDEQYINPVVELSVNHVDKLASNHFDEQSVSSTDEATGHHVCKSTCNKLEVSVEDEDTDNEDVMPVVANSTDRKNRVTRQKSVPRAGEEPRLRGLRQQPKKTQLFQAGQNQSVCDELDKRRENQSSPGRDVSNKPSARSPSNVLVKSNARSHSDVLVKSNARSHSDVSAKSNARSHSDVSAKSNARSHSDVSAKPNARSPRDSVNSTKRPDRKESNGFTASRGQTDAAVNSSPDAEGKVCMNREGRSPGAKNGADGRSSSTKRKSECGARTKQPEAIVLESEEDLARVVEVEPNLGRLVWARLCGGRWWPGLIVMGTMIYLQSERNNSSWIYWFGDHKVSQISQEKILPFADSYCSKIGSFKSKLYRTAVMEALQECKRRSGEHINNDSELLLWAESGFHSNISGSIVSLEPDEDKPVPDSVREHLRLIGEEIRRKSAYVNYDKDEMDTEREDAVSAVRNGEKKLQDVCIACADPDQKVQVEHPLFEGGLCAPCQIEVAETMYAEGDDGLHSFCAVCGAGGDLFVCDAPECKRVYCRPCVEELGGDAVLQQVIEASKWQCFMCSPYTDQSDCLLCLRSDWQQRVILFFDTGYRVQVPSLDYFAMKRPLRVLSLFDGIASGKLALDQLGLRLDVYYASEIDPDALVVTRCNHGNTIVQLGDVTKLEDKQLSGMVPIDLLIGGSPCNDLSLANPGRKGFEFGSTALLAFDFVRVRNKLQALNGHTHLFWLYENVASMKTEFKNTLSRFLECQPALWDAKYMSAQRRGRYFWGNIPGLYSTPAISTHMHEQVNLTSVLETGCDRRAVVEKMRCVTTRTNSLKHGKHDELFPVEMAGEASGIWISEVERLFGFPTHYTDVGNLPVTRRQKLLGRSWNIPIVKQILSPLSRYFATDGDLSPPPTTDLSPPPTTGGNNQISPQNKESNPEKDQSTYKQTSSADRIQSTVEKLEGSSDHNHSSEHTPCRDETGQSISSQSSADTGQSNSEE